MAPVSLQAAPATSPDPAGLERAYGGLDAGALVATALSGDAFGAVAIVSSFGADSAVLLHVASEVNRDTPILFVDSGKHFPETLAYRDRLTELLGLRAVRTVAATAAELRAQDPAGVRHRVDPDGCCELRKVRPLETALAPFDTWINGRRREQAATRADLPRFERDAAGRLKLNPLHDWSREMVAAYLRRHDLPRHPLVAQGYPSIGCAACTSRVRGGEDPRAGRWRGTDKTECGLHLVDGRLQAAAARR